MKSLMSTNIYDVSDTIVIVGSCLEKMQPKAFDKLLKISNSNGNNVYEVCLEETHINMVITKIAGMIRTNKVRQIIFATVDKSPHCIQLHYIQEELTKLKLNYTVTFGNFVADNDDLTAIYKDAINASKNLKELNQLYSMDKKNKALTNNTYESKENTYA
jgi:hypothetical protein